MRDPGNEKAPTAGTVEASNLNATCVSPAHRSTIPARSEGGTLPCSREVVSWALAAFYAAARDGGDFIDAFTRRFAALRHAGLPLSQNRGDNAGNSGVTCGP